MKTMASVVARAGLLTLVLLGGSLAGVRVFLPAPPAAAAFGSVLLFRPGETLTYGVTWAAFPAGRIVATVKRVGEGAGDAYEIEASARSQGFVSLLYRVEDDFHSVIDPVAGCSQRISKTVNEGRRHKKTEIHFDPSRRLAILDEQDLARPGHPAKHAENPAPPCVADIVAAFYFPRRQPLRVGETLSVPVNDGGESRVVSVQVQAREEIQTPIGRRPAFRLEPTVFGNLYKRKGRLLVWYSDDADRLPLRIKAMMTVGAIEANLQSVVPGQAAEAQNRR